MNRLAIALQTGFIKMTGTTNSVELIPVTVLDQVGRQVGSGGGMLLISAIRGGCLSQKAENQRSNRDVRQLSALYQ